MTAYFRTYGPASPDRVLYWLGEGLSAGRKAIKGWLADLGERLVTIDVDGDAVMVLREDLEDLSASSPTSVVRLLPGQDQWVMGPGTADSRVVPPAQRPAVSRGAHLVLVGGVVSGTWSLRGDRLDVSWFPEAGAVGHGDLADEASRVGAVLGRSRVAPRQ